MLILSIVLYVVHGKNYLLEAISIYKCLFTKVNFDKYIGYSKCDKICASSIIDIKSY